eukprot:7320604-Prymnesium_polylepis.1
MVPTLVPSLVAASVPPAVPAAPTATATGWAAPPPVPRPQGMDIVMAPAVVLDSQETVADDDDTDCDSDVSDVGSLPPSHVSAPSSPVQQDTSASDLSDAGSASNVATPHRAREPADFRARPDRRDCKYGDRCYQVNKSHWERFNHPEALIQRRRMQQQMGLLVD